MALGVSSSKQVSIQMSWLRTGRFSPELVPQQTPRLWEMHCPPGGGYRLVSFTVAVVKYDLREVCLAHSCR